MSAARPLHVVVGASNVALGLVPLVEALARRSAGPFDLALAHGHGRSFGRPSRYFARELPGVLECGLWPALERDGRPLASALVLDVGNDLMYGVRAAELATWVAEVLARLDARGARTALAAPPRERLERVSRLGFALVHATFFGRHRVRHEDVRRELAELDAALGALATARAFVQPPIAWYGLDPIHVRRARRPEAWETLVAAALGPPGAEPSPARPLSAGERAALRGLRPAWRRLWGRAQEHAQPAATLADGSTIAWY